jgi:hypothetical protein
MPGAYSNALPASCYSRQDRSGPAGRMMQLAASAISSVIAAQIAAPGDPGSPVQRQLCPGYRIRCRGGAIRCWFAARRRPCGHRPAGSCAGPGRRRRPDAGRLGPVRPGPQKSRRCRVPRAIQPERRQIVIVIEWCGRLPAHPHVVALLPRFGPHPGRRAGGATGGSNAPAIDLTRVPACRPPGTCVVRNFRDN